jgi:hypothetical protein
MKVGERTMAAVSVIELVCALIRDLLVFDSTRPVAAGLVNGGVDVTADSFAGSLSCVSLCSIVGLERGSLREPCLRPCG